MSDTQTSAECIGSLNLGARGWSFGRFHGETPNNAIRDYTFGIVRWDIDNLLPQRTLELRQKSPTLCGVIDRRIALAAGKAVGSPDPKLAAWMKTCNGRKGYANLREMLISDLETYNTFCIGVEWSEDGVRVKDLFWQDVSQMRKGFRYPNDDDKEAWREKGLHYTGKDVVQTVAISNNWYSPTTSPGYYGFVDQHAYFDPECPTVNKPQFVIIEPAMQGYVWYGLPPWYSCFLAASAEIQIEEYRESIGRSSFTAGGFLFLPPSTDTEGVEKTQEDVQSLSSGTAAGRTMVFQMRDSEGKPVYVEVPQVFNDKNSLKEFQDAVTESIAKANGVPSLTVLGLPGGPSLSGDATTMQAAQLQYQRQMIKRRALVDSALEKLLEHCGFPNPVVVVDNEIYDPELEVKEEDDKAAEGNPELAGLRASVGGIQAVAQLQTSVGLGENTVEGARALLTVGFGYKPEEAALLIPDTLGVQGAAAKAATPAPTGNAFTRIFTRK